MTQVAGKSYNFKDLAHFVDDIKFLLTRGGDGNISQNETVTKKILGWVVFVLLIGVIIYVLYLVYCMVFRGYSRTLRDFFTLSFSHQEDTLQVVGAEQGQFYKALVGLHDNKLNRAFQILEINGYPVNAGECNGEDCGDVFKNLFNTIDNYYEPDYGSEKNMKAITEYYMYYSQIFKPLSLSTISFEERISKLTQMIDTLYKYEELYNNILDLEVRKVCFANTGKDERERSGNDNNLKQLESELKQMFKQYDIEVVTTGKDFATYYTAPIYIARCGQKTLKQFYDEVLKSTPHQSLLTEVKTIEKDIALAYQILKKTLPEGIEEQNAKIKALKEMKLSKEISMARYRKRAQEQATEQYRQQTTEVLVDIKKKKKSWDKKLRDKISKGFKKFGKSIEKEGKKATREAERKLSNFGRKTRDTITNTALDAKDKIANAGLDAKDKIANAGLDVRDRMRDFGKETDYKFKKFGEDTKNEFDKMGRTIQGAFGEKVEENPESPKSQLRKPEKSRHQRQKSQHIDSQRIVSQRIVSQPRGSQPQNSQRQNDAKGDNLPISSQDVSATTFDESKAQIDIIKYEEDGISPILEKRKDGKQNKIYIPCYNMYHHYVVMNKKEKFNNTSMSDEELVAYLFMKDYQMIQNRSSNDDVKSVPILERILRMQVAMEKVAKMTSYSVGNNTTVRNLLYYIFMTDDSTLDDAKDDVMTNRQKITFAYSENKFDNISVSNDYSWYIMELLCMTTSLQSFTFDTFFSQLLTLTTTISIEKMQTLNVYLNINKKPPGLMENLQLEPSLVQFAIQHPIFTSVYLSQVVSIDTRSLNKAAIDAKLKNAYNASSNMYDEIKELIPQLTPPANYDSVGSVIDALKTNLHNLKEAFIYMHIVHLYLTEYKTTSGLKERVREDRLVREGFVELIGDQLITEKEFFMKLITPFKNDLIDMRVVGAWKDVFYSDRFKHDNNISYWRDFKAYWVDYLRPKAEKAVVNLWKDVGKTAKSRFA
jgi:predicted secreted protein